MQIVGLGQVQEKKNVSSMFFDFIDGAILIIVNFLSLHDIYSWNMIFD